MLLMITPCLLYQLPPNQPGLPPHTPSHKSGTAP